MDDAAIIRLYWDRDEQAISETDRKYGSLCRRLAFNILSSREDSEECVNDTWCRAWDTMPPQHPDSLRAYLGRIVRNLSVSRLRRRTAQKRGGGYDILLSELEDCVCSPDDSVEQEIETQELAKLISLWLHGLPEDDRALFVRRYWFADSVSLLSRQWYCPVNRISKRLLRLRQSLRQYLQQEGMQV